MRATTPALLLALLLLLAACGDDAGDAPDDGSADDGAAGSAGDGADDEGTRPRFDEGIPISGGFGDGDGDGGDGDSSSGDSSSGDGDTGGDGDAGGDGDGDDASAVDALPLPCDVAGVLEGHCIRCHGARPQLGAPMSLLSWDDLTASAPSDASRPLYELVVERVLSTDNRMPPAPDPGLGRAQIDALERWVEDGAEPGDNDACLLPR